MVTVIATWLVASLSRRKRIYGFFVFLVSNVLWVIWGWGAEAYALIVLQIALLAMNVRGIRKITIGRNDRASQSIKDHLAIIDALEKRDTELAGRLCRDHTLGLAFYVQNHSEGIWPEASDRRGVSLQRK